MPVLIAPELTVAQVEQILRSLKHDRQKAQRNYERKPAFTPEPGRRDADLYKIEQLTETIEVLEAYL